MAKLGYLRRNNVELIICKQSTISYPLHNHVSVFTLGFILEGTIELTTDKGSKLYQENDAFLILPYTPHYINAKSCYTLLSLCISTDWVANSEIEKINSVVISFLHEAINNSEVAEKIYRAFCGFILISRMIPLQNETAISRLKTQLEMYPEHRCSIDDMSKITFISKYNLIRAFKNEVGLTPHQFQIQNRIRKAQRLLEGTATIAEAASATGFCDQSHFIRHFGKLVGLTPTDYKLACEVTLPLSVD
ncbi:MAG: helix-turn-helix transcriptional regulator [Lachnospiraceae bacterium]|nr:helix-turn-helix transcriptional regulator [Lachnospiraceae bacterium]